MHRAIGRIVRVLLPVLLVFAPACSARAKPPAPVAKAAPAILEIREGLASYYGAEFDGKLTASGIPFNKDSMVAAHPSYPFGTTLRVTNLRNGRAVQVRVVDRGPARAPRQQGVIIDVSSAAAGRLGFVRSGRTRVRLEVLRWGA